MTLCYWLSSIRTSSTVKSLNSREDIHWIYPKQQRNCKIANTISLNHYILLTLIIKSSTISKTLGTVFVCSECLSKNILLLVLLPTLNIRKVHCMKQSQDLSPRTHFNYGWTFIVQHTEPWGARC